MDIETLELSLIQYRTQLAQINVTLDSITSGEERDSLIGLKDDIQQLIDLTAESLTTVKEKISAESNEGSCSGLSNGNVENKNENGSGDALDDEYKLFMMEMEKSGAYDDKKTEEEKEVADSAISTDNPTDTNIEEELSSLEGMKCSTMYSHKWGGAPTLHNAMVCSVIRDEEDNTNFYDIKVRVMFTNPTHLEMVPCPYYLDGECRFSNDQCKFSHGEVVHLSSLSEAMEPNFSLLKAGSRILTKLKQKDQATSSKLSERYLLWHRAVVRSVDSEQLQCEVSLEHNTGMPSGPTNTHTIDFKDIFPLTDSTEELDTDTESSSSEGPTCQDENRDDFKQFHRASTSRESSRSFSASGSGGSFNPTSSSGQCSSAAIQLSLTQNPGAVKLGDWEKHTKGIGSKLMQKMGYVVGAGLGKEGKGRLQPVPCRPMLPGRSLDHCIKLKDNEDPIKAEKRLRRLQKKQEEREKKAYERAKERERHNVFNVLNDVLSGTGSNTCNGESTQHDPQFPSKKMKADKITDVKSSSCKNLNIEQFKISEDIKRLERDILKLRGSLGRNTQGSNLHKSLTLQLALKSREVESLRERQANVSTEQTQRKDKKKMTVF